MIKRKVSRRKITYRIRKDLKLSFSDRISRLVLMTAILGALTVIYLKVSQVIFHSLTTKIYLQSYVNTEHILASCVLSTGLLVLIYAVWYCYCELNALNHSHILSSKSLDIVNKADKSYSTIFNIIKIYISLSILITVASVLIIGVITENSVIISLCVLLLLIALLLITIPKSRKLILNKLRIILNSNNNKVPILVWIVFTLFMFFAIIIAMSLHQNRLFKIKFDNSPSIPITFHFTNMVPEKISISYYSVNSNSITTLTKKKIINKSDFYRSFIEITEQPDSSSNSSWLEVIDRNIRRSQKTISTKSKYDYKYELHSIDYLKMGQNFVIIEFTISSEIKDKFYRIVNQVDVNNDGVRITTENFE